MLEHSIYKESQTHQECCNGEREWHVFNASHFDHQILVWECTENNMSEKELRNLKVEISETLMNLQL